MQILERFRKPRPQEEAVAPVPEIRRTETRQTPDKESYPNNIIAVLQRLKRLARNGVNHAEFLTESDKASLKLLEIYKDGVEEMKLMTTKSGGKWEGKVTLGQSLGEQDGASWYEEEGVVIGEQYLKVFSDRDYSCGDVDQKQLTNGVISPDCQQIFWVTYKDTKIFSGEPVVLEDIKVQFENNRISEISVTEAPKVPGRTGSFYERPVGLTTELQAKFRT